RGARGGRGGRGRGGRGGRRRGGDGRGRVELDEPGHGRGAAGVQQEEHVVAGRGQGRAAGRLGGQRPPGARRHLELDEPLVHVRGVRHGAGADQDRAGDPGGVRGLDADRGGVPGRRRGARDGRPRAAEEVRRGVDLGGAGRRRAVLVAVVAGG